MPDSEPQRDHLTIIDDALARIDDELAAKYPGVAASRASLLKRRQQLLSTSNPSVFVVVPAAASSEMDGTYLVRRAPHTDHWLSASYRLLFGAVTASVAPVTGIWHEQDVEVITSPQSAEITTSANRALQLAG